MTGVAESRKSNSQDWFCLSSRNGHESQNKDVRYIISIKMLNYIELKYLQD